MNRILFFMVVFFGTRVARVIWIDTDFIMNHISHNRDIRAMKRICELESFRA
jgi:hypothetical protein